MKRRWKNYGLSIVLFFMFFVSWIGQFIFQWQEFINTSIEHSQQPQFNEFIPEFLAATFENWQSEFLQLLMFVVLTAYLIHKGSPESKDSDDKMQASLDRIERLLKAKKSNGKSK